MQSKKIDIALIVVHPQNTRKNAQERCSKVTPDDFVKFSEIQLLSSSPLAATAWIHEGWIE